MLASFTGCITRKACDRKFPAQLSDSVRVDTVKTIVCVPDTIFLPAQEAEQDFNILDSLLNYHATFKKGSISGKIDIAKGKVKVICHEDSLQKIVDRFETKIAVTTTEKKTENKPPIIEYRTKWYDITCRWIVIALLIYIGIRLFIVYLKKV